MQEKLKVFTLPTSKSYFQVTCLVTGFETESFLVDTPAP